MTPDKENARPRYQRQPRTVHPRRRAPKSYHNHELLGAFLALALVVVLIWGFSWAYQMGLKDGAMRSQEASQNA